MESQAVRLKAAVGRFRAVHRLQVAKLAAIRVLWLALALALLAVYADVLLALEDRPRLMADGAIAVVLLATAVLSYRWHTRAVSEERMVARLIEAGHPELGNDLTNALDFHTRLEQGPPEHLSEALMKEEIAVAAERAGALDDVEALKPPSLRKEGRVLIACAGAGLVLALAFPNVVRAVAPRFLDPLGDHPPYSPTRLAVLPDDAKVYYGENWKVTVKASGETPEKIQLVLRDAAGNEKAALPMFEGNKGEYFQTIEDVREDLVYFARIPGGRSKRHALTVIKTPRIEGATVVYDYPDYTGKRSETVDLTEPRVLRAYAGTRVTLTLVSNRPLKEGVLLAAGKELPMAAAGERAVSVTFPLTEAGDFRASVRDVDGIESRQPLDGTIEILEDRKPTVSVASPGMDSFAIPDAEVPIAIEAMDDLGIAKVSLIRSLNKSPDVEKELWRGEGAQTFAGPVEILNLAELGVRPGDVIDYYATATDTAPTPQTAATQPFKLKIISFEEYREFMQARMTAEDLLEKYNALLDGIEALAEAQEKLKQEIDALRQKLESGEGLTPEESARLADLERQQAELAQQAEQLRQRLEKEAERPGIYDVEQAYKEVLRDIAQRLEEAERAMRAGAEGLRQAGQPEGQEQPAPPAGGAEGGPQAQALAQASTSQQQALEALGRVQEAFEQGIAEPNEEIAAVSRLLEDGEVFKQLYEQQKGLERQARTLQQPGGSELDRRLRMKEVAEEQQKVREALEQLKNDLREHARPVEEKYPKLAQDARDIADEIESRAIEPSMAKGAEHLGRGEGKPGHAEVRRAYEKMEQMIEFCEAAAGAGLQACETRLRLTMPEGLGNTFNQLSKGMAQAAMGRLGYSGRGQSGESGGSAPFGVYGHEQAGTKSEMPAGRIRHRADSVGRPLPPEEIAPKVEEKAASSPKDITYEAAGGEPFIDEYRSLIEAYFQGLAEEGQ